MKCLLPIFIAVVGFLSQAAYADEVPHSNGLLDYMGGELDSETAHVIGGNYHFGLSGPFSIQVDGALGEVADSSMTGFGVHLYWHDPEIGLLDANASRLNWKGNGLNRYALNGKWYTSITTFSGSVEYQNGDAEKKVNLFAGLDLYPIDILSLNVGAAQVDGEAMAQLGFELQPALDRLPALTLLGGAAKGEGDYSYYFLGLRYYFGTNAPLIQRHRREFPQFTGSLSYGSGIHSLKTEIERREAQVDGGAANPDQGPFP
ncbi:MAG: hypothetical protein OI74_07485 [Gammaproteobacteria bacterium (ex Lamellibrachia satsuma)]|nr:MAG: hypothetical protein HPY30_16150 [Gammaproteobacteria bacterium (ex Lamellibrachia satsuma)]RRS33609.1 MAG: hypothetical protein OI74_07485 [Gammaproteobacteria bacterium (ex Lamellibrachia satsuma)]RRS37611.1 MAG: hypothetical protein NV67_00150 [Gammaproteobacteria bacterium (ex Lamellibrachia satsuma)]